MNIDDLTYGELKQIAAIVACQSTAVSTSAKPIGFTIVVASGGFVYVGDCTWVAGGLNIENAYNVRKWGTTKGLGQLALQGHQEKTVRDPCGSVFIPTNAVMHTIKTDGALWAK